MERIIEAIFQLVFADAKVTLGVVAIIVVVVMMALAGASGQAAGSVLTSAFSTR